jgi:hypothetical protein
MHPHQWRSRSAPSPPTKESQPPRLRQSGWQHYRAKRESSQPRGLKVDATEQHIETNNQEHHKEHPCHTALPAGGHITLGHLLTLLTACSEQITGLALTLIVLLEGGVTKLYATLIASLKLCIIVAGVIAKLSGFATKRLTYSKHIFFSVILFYKWPL